MAHRIDGEVIIVAPAEKHPHRHAGTCLAFIPGVLIQTAARGVIGPGTLRDLSGRTMPILTRTHIRRAEKSRLIQRGRGLAFSLGLVANWRCPGKLRYGHAWKDCRAKRSPQPIRSCGLHYFSNPTISETKLYIVTLTSLSSRLKRPFENPAIGTETQDKDPGLAWIVDPGPLQSAIYA